MTALGLPRAEGPEQIGLSSARLERLAGVVRADVETGVVEVQLQGACSSCAISSATLSGGVERILRERLDWVTEVLGGVDDSLSLDESAALGSGGYVPSL